MRNPVIIGSLLCEFIVLEQGNFSQALFPSSHYYKFQYQVA